MFNLLRSYLDNTLRQLNYPCVLCHQSSSLWSLCQRCQDMRYKKNTERCLRCALALPPNFLSCPDCCRRQTWFDYTYHAFDYRPPYDGLIIRYKNKQELALANIMGKMMSATLETPSIYDIVMAVPARPSALLWRGFNPATELARIVAKHTMRPLHQQLIERAKNDIKQSQLNRKNRYALAHGQFRLLRSPKVSCALIIDDVMTTGSTLNTLAYLLKQAGVQRVDTLVAGRAMLSSHLITDF